jgi:hypothetical protein
LIAEYFTSPVVAYLNHKPADRVLPEVVHKTVGFRPGLPAHELVKLTFEFNGDVRTPVFFGTATVDLKVVF